MEEVIAFETMRDIYVLSGTVFFVLGSIVALALTSLIAYVWWVLRPRNNP